ncbi:galactose oxidase [Negadavirga shengliensis]|uniref:Galactose oxidase n=1 Tax=Negadavirga shengliensis TaxID=1389218 RepID=A0ABV9T8F4_9BACT
MKSWFKKYLIPICCLLSISSSVSGQFYGLSFSGSETVQDKRTGLDLSPDNTLCLDKSFRLSFDISFQPDQLEYFGYVFRIIDGENRNIDLISNLHSPDASHFVVINEGNSTPHSFDLQNTGIFSDWNRFVFDFDYENQEVRYSFLGISNVQSMSFEPGSCFKILFGANDYPKFKTTDVPPMNIRDIEIVEGGVERNKWLLDQHHGNSAQEKISGQNGHVRHPLWIRKMRMEWKLLKNFTTEGPISVGFNPNDELLYFIGLDSLLSFSCANNRLTRVPYESGRLHLLRGNQSFFDQHQKQLHNIYLDQETISTYDEESQTWNKNFEPPSRLTDNWQYNKFYSPVDSAIYILGGYGHFIYKNKVRRYHLPTETWDSIIPPADAFTPRYLAALGAVDEGAYVLGGYGTFSGQQIHNPTNLYDLVYFDVKERTFKKLFDLKVKEEEFVFANSLVIDEQNRSYYGLIFSKHQYNSNLQLIKGSLDSAVYIEVGNKMPFKFYDINSFADLYYAPKLDRFFAVTLFHNTENQTEAAIFSIAAPPIPVEEENHPETYPGYVIILLIGGTLLLGSVAYYFKKRNTTVPDSHTLARVPQKSQKPIIPGQPAENPHRNDIYLFGVFQLFDDKGDDITKNFTPLIRELFLVILLYTIRWERGISSEKLKDLLWHDKSAESARNNRSVNIAKLKTILAEVKGCQISKETGYWKVNLDPSQINVDYQDYNNIIQDKKFLSKNRIQQLIAIVQRGSFLSNLEYEWLDVFKSEISNEVIDIYINYTNSIDISEDPEFIIEIANYIFYFDMVNEEAMMLKCKALVHLGKHSLAKGVFENFKKEYKNIYDEDFSKDFQTILE